MQVGVVSFRSFEIFPRARPTPPTRASVHHAVSVSTAPLFTPDDNQRPDWSKRRSCLGELLG